ncbi:tyrosine-type recombinase/integrase [Bosea sp. BH3]|uniref:tyrosine-type recombinase/integrase n=1 Tax=Bosea sp. BH3 TaxID=2871701 RepID=UPI0021CB31E3|nr:tyrosine-type recombinase/integrase [Bosea sp. BH3]MCU4180114.1 tyrosine-type recombinase/integrase [Bosea sp. BH3]
MRLRSSSNPFAVRWAKFAAGERMPFLIRLATGIPIAEPTYWITSARRPGGLQPNTLRNDLRALLHLYLWAEARRVNIEDRLASGALLTLAEIVDLDTFCGRRVAHALTELPSASATPIKKSKRGKGARLETSLLQKRNRLTAIYSFLEYASAGYLSRLQFWPDRWAHYNQVRVECLGWLKKRYEAITKPRGDDIGGSEGLEEDQLRLLRSVIEPDGDRNPFTFPVRFRNYLIVRLLLDLGLRRGELLGLYVEDCKVGGAGSITVHRRPDNPEDPRPEQPSSKTNARTLPLGRRLTEILYEWIVHHRTKIPGAQSHPFLIVDCRNGRPLCLSSVNKMMREMRGRVPGLPANLSAHKLRHSWNDAFSDVMDRNGVAPDDESKWRARLMGWRSEGSAKPYLRRTIRRRSDEVLVTIQDGLEIPDVKGMERTHDQG